MKMLLRINLFLVFSLSFSTIMPKYPRATLRDQVISALTYYGDGQQEVCALQVDALLLEGLDRQTRECVLMFREQIRLENLGRGR